MTDQPTRTEMGYAAWKESESTVREARKVAAAKKAARRLNETLIESWVIPVTEFASQVISRGRP